MVFDEDAEVDESQGDGDATPGPAMLEHFQAIQNRVKTELHKENQEKMNDSLHGLCKTRLAKENNMVIAKHRARDICSKLGVAFTEPANYRDVMVCIPDVHFGSANQTECPRCQEHTQVGAIPCLPITQQPTVRARWLPLLHRNGKQAPPFMVPYPLMNVSNWSMKYIQKERGTRKKDRKKRQPRRCLQCLSYANDVVLAGTCRGRHPRIVSKGCQNYDIDGNPI